MNLSIKFFIADISSVINNLVLWDTLSQHLFSGGNVKGSFSTWCPLNYYHSAPHMEVTDDLFSIATSIEVATNLFLTTKDSHSKQTWLARRRQAWGPL